MLRKVERPRGLSRVETVKRDRLGRYYLWGAPLGRACGGFSSAALEGNVPLEMPSVTASFGRAAPLAWMRQVHGPDVKVVSGPGHYQCDGIFTRSPGLALVVRTADCLPLVFHSDSERSSGVVHMGWRSAESGILENMGVDISSFACVAGPGLRRCCYEVGPDFASRQRIGAYVERRGGKYFFDPIRFAADELARMGLPEGAFYDTGICSFCSDLRLHSYRRNGTSHRTLSFIVDEGGD